jgi:hypothetical protein
MYIKVGRLPSKFKPYPEGTEIRVRELTFGEVMNYNDHRDRPLDVINYFFERGVIDGIDMWEITAGDWQYLQIQITAISFASPSYSFLGPICNNCSKKTNEEKADLSKFNANKMEINSPFLMDAFKEENIPPDLRASLLPSELQFNEINEEAIGPATVDLPDLRKKVSLDFYRLKHYKQLIESGIKNNRANEIATLTGLDLEKEISNNDFEVLDMAYSYMDHGLESKVLIKCPDCKVAIDKEVQWDLMSLIPFHRDVGSIKDRIHFGGGAQSADNPYSRTAVPSGESTLRPLDGEKEIDSA